MVRQGVKIGTLNIGGMAWRPGKKQLTKAVSLDDDDINAFHELNNLGVIMEKVTNHGNKYPTNYCYISFFLYCRNGQRAG